MQAIKSLFSLFQKSQADAAPAGRPAELPAESLALVGGGLPRVGGLGDGTTPDGGTLSGPASGTLPSVG